MYWTLELASKLEDAPWPATKDELIDYATRSGAPLEVIENLNEIEDEGEIYESIEDIWPDYLLTNSIRPCQRERNDRHAGTVCHRAGGSLLGTGASDPCQQRTLFRNDHRRTVCAPVCWKAVSRSRPPQARGRPASIER